MAPQEKMFLKATGLFVRPSRARKASTQLSNISPHNKPASEDESESAPKTDLVAERGSTGLETHGLDDIVSNSQRTTPDPGVTKDSGYRARLHAKLSRYKNAPGDSVIKPSKRKRAADEHNPNKANRTRKSPASEDSSRVFVPLRIDSDSSEDDHDSIEDNGETRKDVFTLALQHCRLPLGRRLDKWLADIRKYSASYDNFVEKHGDELPEDNTGVRHKFARTVSEDSSGSSTAEFLAEDALAESLSPWIHALIQSGKVCWKTLGVKTRFAKLLEDKLNNIYTQNHIMNPRSTRRDPGVRALENEQVVKAVRKHVPSIILRGYLNLGWQLAIRQEEDEDEEEEENKEAKEQATDATLGPWGVVEGY